MIQSLLIANRGEIACRIVRTARRLGVRTVAVFSEADRNALHVREADEAVHIGASSARESYLVGERIIAAARATGAEAIHPGYGFLSENAGFAEAVVAAGLIWVGPPPSAIRAMGLKDAAKSLMIAAGVPVTPGYLGEDQAAERLQAEADAIGYPVLIKAVAGGGGKGMRRVDAPAEFQDMLASCKREAAAAFGDDRVLIEKYILRPRHIEVQVFGDTHGNVVHLFERDCSLQRRHQKVIEEAPAPGMDEAVRASVCEAAVKAAKAVDYVGAGTIEFIADASEGLRADRIWFMEMNTRLQVEHPVTEEITGQDLVEWQLRVASGETLPKRQDELTIEGWAMEARLYAEDPASGFLPSTGKLEMLDLLPKEPEEHRLETGVAAGDTVSPYYDPMIAKLVLWDETRERAANRLASWCEDVFVWPVKTNAAFLARALRDEEFQSGNVDTGLLQMRLDSLLPPAEPSSELLELVARRIVTDAMAAQALSPWSLAIGFRMNAEPSREMLLGDGSRRFATRIRLQPTDGDWQWQLVPHDKGYLINDAGQTRYLEPYRDRGTVGGTMSDGTLLSPMPGRLLSVDVREGDRVTKGQKLLALEAMKMEHNLVAPFDGTVAELGAAQGEQVTEGTMLVRVEKEVAGD